MRLVEERELGIDGGAWEGGQAEQVLLQQGDVGLLVDGRHMLCEGDEEEDPTDLFKFTGKHLKKEKGLKLGFSSNGVISQRSR